MASPRYAYSEFLRMIKRLGRWHTMQTSTLTLTNSSQKDFSMKMGPLQVTKWLLYLVGVSIYAYPCALCDTPFVSGGRRLADAAVCIAITSFLATFSVHKVLDERGEGVPVFPKFSTGIAVFTTFLPSHPSSFLTTILLFQSSLNISLPNCPAIPRCIHGEANAVD